MSGERYNLYHFMQCSQQVVNDLLALQLVKCYALLPRLGGGGKDGINHIESFTVYCEKTINTIECKIQETAIMQ